MNKLPLTILAATLSMLNASAQAAAAQPTSAIQPRDFLLELINSSAATSFNAINHTVINEAFAPGVPSPGDTFVTNGFGVLSPSIIGMELTYSYSIAGTFTGYDPDQDKLFFNHGLEVSGVSNQLKLYIDSPLISDTLYADESNADSYTDGLEIAVMDVVADNPGEAPGYLQASTGTGRDVLTFRLTDSYMEQYGFSDDTVLLNKITSEISLVDWVNEQQQAFDFAAFDGFSSGCGPLNNPHNSCSREVGTSELVISSVPVPASLGLFLSGFGLLGWLKKRK